VTATPDWSDAVLTTSSRPLAQPAWAAVISPAIIRVNSVFFVMRGSFKIFQTISMMTEAREKMLPGARMNGPIPY